MLTSLMNGWKFENISEASFFSAFLICEINKVENFQSYEPLWAGDPLPKWPPRLGPAAGGRKPTGWAEWANAFGLGFTGNRAEILYYSRNKPCMCHSASMTCEQYTSFSRRGLHWKSLFIIQTEFLLSFNFLLVFIRYIGNYSIISANYSYSRILLEQLFSLIF